MKKQLFLGLLAASLVFTGCNRQNNEPSDPEDPLTPAQQESANAINTLIFDLVKDAYGEETAESSKEYVVSVSEHAARKGVDATKITSYIDEGQKLDWEDPLSVLGFVIDVHQDEGLDDAVYFGVALGESMLKGATIAASEETRPLFVTALEDVEKAGDALPESVYAVLDGTVVAVESSLALMSSTTSSVMKVVQSVMAHAVIDPDDLKGTFSEIRAIADEFLKMENSVIYLGDFALGISSDILAYVPEVPEALIPFIAELKVDDYVSALFGCAREFVKALDELPDAYYSHFEEIEIPEESYAYAVLGLLESLVPEQEEVDPEELAKLPGEIVELVSGIYAMVSSEVPEAVGEAIEAILEDDNLEAFIGAAIELLVDASEVDLSFVSAAKVAHLVGVYFASIETTNRGIAFVEYDFDDFKNTTNIPTEVRALIPFDEIEEAISDEASFHWETSDLYAIREFTDTSVKAYVVQFNIEYYANPMEGQEPFMASVQYNDISVSYGSVEEFAPFINEFIELLVSKEGTDLYIDDLAGVLHPLAELLSDHIVSLLGEDDPALESIGMLVMVDALLQNEDFRDLAKAVVNDAFVVVKDIFSSFLPNGETPAAINFTKFFVLLTQVCPNAGIEYLFGKVPEANLQSVKTLATDVYNLVGSLGLTQLVVSKVCESVGVEPSTIKNASDFADLIYLIVCKTFASAE